MIRPVLLVLSMIALIALSACAEDTVANRSDAIQSCYHTGYDIKCVSTPGAVSKDAIDVDGDNELDPFVCGNGVSESDSDVDGTDSDEDSVSAEDETVEQGLNAESDSDSASNSESDTDCGPSEEDDDSDSVSDLDGDGDGDAVADEDDCDCLDVIPPTEGEKPPVIE